LDVDIHDLSRQISFVQKTLWIGGRVLVVDETVLAWLGTGKWKVNLPGKPHPKGMELFVMAQFSSKHGQKPYILGVYPHFPLPGAKQPVTPLNATKYLLRSFLDHYKYPAHAVLDAQFASTSFITWAEQYGKREGGATFALPKTHHKTLFDMLGREVSVMEWRAAYTRMGRVTSFMRKLDKKGELKEW
jgi:hypothetical protein